MECNKANHFMRPESSKPPDQIGSSRYYGARLNQSSCMHELKGGSDTYVTKIILNPKPNRKYQNRRKASNQHHKVIEIGLSERLTHQSTSVFDHSSNDNMKSKPGLVSTRHHKEINKQSPDTSALIQYAASRQ